MLPYIPGTFMSYLCSLGPGGGVGQPPRVHAHRKKSSNTERPLSRSTVPETGIPVVQGELKGHNSSHCRL